MAVTIYGRPQGAATPGAPATLELTVHHPNGGRAVHRVSLWDHGDQLAHDAAHGDRNARGVLADWADENAEHFQAVPHEYRPYVGQLIRRGHRYPPEPPVQMSRRPRRLTRVGDSNTHDAMAEEIVRTQDPQGLRVLADFLQENGGAGAYLARRAGENGQHTVDASHPFTPNEWWEGDNPTNNGQWTGEAGQDTQGLPTGPGELEIRSGYNRNTGRGILTTVHHPHGNLRRGSRTVEYHVPVESVADLHHLTADLPEPQRARIHAHLEPHLPPGGEPAQMSRRVTPRRYSVPAPNPDPGRRGQSPNEVYLRLRAKGIDHDRAARFSGWTGKEPPGAGGVHVPVVNPPVVGGSESHGEPRDDVGGQREMRVPLSRRGGVRRYAENDGRENEFHAHLDAHPDDHHARMVFADYLQERDDPRAEGYRALGKIGRNPVLSGPKGRFQWTWGSDENPEPSHRKFAEPALLPHDWMTGVVAQNGLPSQYWRYHKTRRDADDAAATAFSRLPPERQAELLNPPSTEEPTHHARHRKRREGQVTRYAGEPPDVPHDGGEEEPEWAHTNLVADDIWGLDTSILGQLPLENGTPLHRLYHGQTFTTDDIDQATQEASNHRHRAQQRIDRAEKYDTTDQDAEDHYAAADHVHTALQNFHDNLDTPGHYTRRPSVSSKVRYAAKSSKDVGEALRETAFRLNDELELGPDYNRLFWNPKTKVAWYVTADGDEESEVKKVRNALENVPGVDHVRVEAEYFPPDDDSGWVEMYDRNDQDEGWKPWPPKERKSRRRYDAWHTSTKMVVAGSTYDPGFVPKMDGEFMRAASKLAPQQQVPTVSYAPKTSPVVDAPKADVTTGRRRRRRRKVEAAVEKPDVTKLTKDRCVGTTSVGTKLSRRLTMTPVLYADATDRKSFMKAITENPDDSTTRMVFADWLEENEPNTHPDVLHTLRNHKGRTWVGLSPKGAVNAIPRLSKEILEKYPNREAYHATSTNRKGQAHRVRISGKMQTWKTRPGEFRVPWKFGLYDNGEFTHNNVHEWLAGDPTAEPG